MNRLQEARRKKKRRKIIVNGIVFFLLGCILLVFAYLSKENEAEVTHMTQIKMNQTKNEEKSLSKERESHEKANKTDEQQVVNQKATVYLDKQKSFKREELIPKGAIVEVKPVPENEEILEIKTEHNKGFIEKKFLEPREKLQKKRECKKSPTLSPEKVKQLLDKKIETFIAKNGGDLSIFIETVDNSLRYGYQEKNVRRTASSIKLAFITYMMKLADDGVIDLSEELTYTENDYYGGTGIIQESPFGSRYSLEKLAELVIRYSDNIAYLKLINRLGENNFVAFLKKVDTESENNRYFSTAKVLTSYMKYVNDNKESSTHIKKLYHWLKQSTFDDGVAIGIPAVDVVHKTGWMPMYSVSNDIALVESDRPYYLTIMTNGYSEQYSEQAISDLAEMIDECVLKLI